MFTKGQWVFGILFAVAFITTLIYTYRKDLKLHKKYYKIKPSNNQLFNYQFY